MTDIDKNIDNSSTPDPVESKDTTVETPDAADQESKKEKKAPTAWTKLRGSRITVSIIAILLATVPLVATRLAVLATETGRHGSHYLTDSEHYTTFITALICTLILSLLPFVLLDRAKFGKEHLVPRILNLIPAIGSAVAAWLFFYFSTARVFEGESKWAFYIAICGGITAIYFLLKIAGNSLLPNVMAGLRVLTAIGVFAFCALIIISLYLDYNTELNSHFKLSVQFGAVGVMLGTMADTRSAIGSVSKRRYLSFKALALTLTSTGAASVLVRASDELSHFKSDQGLTSLSVDDLVIHFQSSPSASASYVICSLFFVTYAASAAAEIIFTVFSKDKTEA